MSKLIIRWETEGSDSYGQAEYTFNGDAAYKAFCCLTALITTLKAETE